MIGDGVRFHTDAWQHTEIVVAILVLNGMRDTLNTRTCQATSQFAPLATRALPPLPSLPQRGLQVVPVVHRLDPTGNFPARGGSSLWAHRGNRGAAFVSPGGQFQVSPDRTLSAPVDQRRCLAGATFATRVQQRPCLRSGHRCGGGGWYYAGVRPAGPTSGATPQGSSAEAFVRPPQATASQSIASASLRAEARRPKPVASPSPEPRCLPARLCSSSIWGRALRRHLLAQSIGSPKTEQIPGAWR